MGLTSAQGTPQQQILKGTPGRGTGGDSTAVGTPTPSNFLDTIRKPNAGTGLKEHERTVDDLKKESFDLKLRVYQLEDALRKVADVHAVHSENENLKSANEALRMELQSLKSVLVETQSDMEMSRREQGYLADQASEVERLKTELNMANSQLSRSIAQIKSYEQQLELFDKESLETTKKIKQLEMESISNGKKVSELYKMLAEREQEIKELQDELVTKNTFVQQVKSESQTVHAELEMLMRQKQELEGRLRLAENERDTIKAELDPARRRLMETVGQQQAPPGSPRSSMDLMESRLLRHMGAASKQMELLTKSQALSQNEKEHLQGELRRLMSEINGGMRTVMVIFERITSHTGIRPTLVNEMGIERALEEVAKLVEALLNDYDDVRQHGEGIANDLKTAHEEVAQLRHMNDKLNERARVAQEQLSLVEQEAEMVRLTGERQEVELLKLQKQLRTINDVDLARYREQCVTLQSTVATLENELAAREKRLFDAKLELEAQRRRSSELEAELARTSADSLSHGEELASLRKERNDLQTRLVVQEDVVAEASKKLEEARQQLAMAERTKVRIQESFEKELRSLHSINSELKVQLTAATTGKTTNDMRLERLQTSLSLLESTNEELLAKLHTKEAAYSAVLREHETLVIEKQTMERELADSQEVIRRTEGELNRLRRAEMASRRGSEGLEHLQAKIDSLTSINGILREQVEGKECALQEAEEKLRRQEEAIRRAYADCDAQHQKIKKREMVISRVLKRLENINAIAGLTEDLAANGEHATENGTTGGGDLRF